MLEFVLMLIFTEINSNLRLKCEHFCSYTMFFFFSLKLQFILLSLFTFKFRNKNVGFKVLTALSTIMAVFRIVLFALKMQAARNLETSLIFYQTTRF